MRAFLAAIFFPALGWGACTEISTKVWYCASTGNPTTDATTFYNFMDSQPFACGDTIILPANTRWHGNAYGLKPQTGCNGKYTKIYSDRVSEIPFGAKRNLINYRDKMVWFTTDSAAIFSLCNASWGTAGHRCANNYDIQGIRFSNYTVHSTVTQLVFAISVSPSSEADVIETGFPRNIAFRRNIIEDRERELYGEANSNTNTDGNAFGGTVSIGLAWTGYGLEYTDCYCNLTGFYINGWQSVTSATEANPAVISATGLTAAVGGSVGVPMLLVIRGATGAWVNLNGVKYGTPTDANSIEIRLPNPTVTETVGATFNSSSLGALAGTVSVSSRQGNLEYCFLGNYGGDAQVLDNYFEGWNITVLTGGSAPPYIGPAVVQSGSTASSIIVSHVRGLSVGDVFTVDMPPGSPMSTYCDPNQFCNPAASGAEPDANLYRKGRVTAITGTGPYTLSVVPLHIDGIDIAPKVGGNIWWQSYNNSRIRISGNEIGHNGYLNNNSQPGKGPIEIKEGTNILMDGNVLGGYLDANGVIRANVMKNAYSYSADQKGKNPNHTSQYVAFSNNTWSGQDAAGNVRCAAWTTAPQLGSGYLHSAKQGGHVFFDHNLFVGCDYPASGAAAIYGVQGNKNGRWQHNTFYWAMPPTHTTYFATHTQCRPYFGQSFEPPDWQYYYGSADVSVKDNIAPYGSGIVVGSGSASLSTCWPTYQDDIKTNAIVDISTQLANQGALDAVLPGNLRVANWTSFWTSTCAYDSWLNCVIDPGHAAKGTASDGSDPGADVLQINDRLHRWSERAGLLKADISVPAMVNNPGAWNIGSTLTAITFRLFASTPASGCTVKIYTNMNRTTLHGDTDSGGEQACNRAGSVSSDGLVSFVAGTSVALTANTEYAYEITDGTRKMVGRFRTLAAGSASQAVRVSYGSSRTGSYCTDTAMSTGCTSISSSATHSVVVPQGTVRYYQAAGGAVRPMVAR